MSLCLFVRLFYVNACIYVIWINQTCLNFSPSQLFNSVVPLQESFFGRRFLVRAGDRDVLVSFSSMQCLTLSNRQVRMTMRTTPRFRTLDGLPRVSHSGVTQHWSSQLYEAANSKVRCGRSQVTTVFRGAPLDTLQTVTCVWMNKLKFVIFMWLILILKTRWCHFPIFHHADVLKTITTKGGTKEEGRRKKKLRQYPTLAELSARIDHCV